VTSEYPYPGANPGSDGSSQPDPYDASPQQRPQYGPDGQLTPFDAFGGPATQDDEPAPKAAARASVRMPPGLVVSTPPPAEAGPPPDQPARGAVYGGSPAIYGSPAPAEYGQPSQRPEPPQQPQQRPEPATYGQPSQPATYGQPSRPEPATYGQPSQSSQPATYGSPEPRVYGRPAAQDEDDAAVPSAARAAVPQQRTSGVYGQRQAPPDAPAQPSGPTWPETPQPAAPAWPDAHQPAAPAWPEAPQPAAPAWPDQIPNADQSGRPQSSARPAEAPPQFEQHGRRTQGPGGYGSDAAPPRAIAWQDQLQPMTSAPAPQSPPPSRTMPAPADVAVIPIQPRSKFRIVGYIVIVLAIVGLGAGALWYTSRTDPPAVGTCVAQSGDVAIGAPCSQGGAFRVTKSVSDVSQCTDYLNQPSLSYTSSGKQIVLCLEPAAGAPAAAPSAAANPSTPPSTPAS
jgi:hypothetical protein